MMKAVVGLALALAVGSFGSPVAAQDTATNAVYSGIRDRLALMKPVAAWKVQRKAPVEDLERERIVVDSSIRNAEAARIDGPSAKAFFEAQIAAAKDIQSCWMDRWSSGKAEAPAVVRDLVADIRPKLIDLGAKILEEIAFAFKQSEGLPFDPAKGSEFVAGIDVDCLSDDAKHDIYRALVDVRLNEQ